MTGLEVIGLDKTGLEIIGLKMIGLNIFGVVMIVSLYLMLQGLYKFVIVSRIL